MANVANKHIRHGIGAVRPYLYGHIDLPEFVKKVFGAVELERLKVGDRGFHVEARIGDSMVVVEAGEPPHPSATRNSVYVYVSDVDAAYRRAIAAGASSLTAPEDKTYGERAAGVKDTFGNIWYIATFKDSAR